MTTEQKAVLKMEKLTLVDLPGVGAATAEKLESAGYHDLMSLAVSTLGELMEVTGVSEAVARFTKELGPEYGQRIAQLAKEVEALVPHG